MKKITIGLNTKDINNARKYLLNLKKKLPTMVEEFVGEVAKWVVDRANDYIKNADLGSLVKIGIMTSWRLEKTSTGIKAINDYNVEKTIGGKRQTVPVAILVEFGVGVVGQSQAHPNATAEGYEYNVDSGRKYPDGTWRFYTDSENLDLPQSALNYRFDFGEKRGKGSSAGHRLQVYTKGSKGVWYAYNAIVDAQMELAKSGGGEIGKMWEDIKARYIK
jgi:hypothetical protein